VYFVDLYICYIIDNKPEGNRTERDNGHRNEQGCDTGCCDASDAGDEKIPEDPVLHPKHPEIICSIPHELYDFLFDYIESLELHLP
jgi:hypothetical protein